MRCEANSILPPRKLKATWSRSHWVLGTLLSSTWNYAYHSTVLQPCVFLLACTFVCILFLLMCLDTYPPSLLFNRCPLLNNPANSILYIFVDESFGLSYIQNKWRDPGNGLRVATRSKVLGTSWCSTSARLVSLPMTLPFPSSGLAETSSQGWSKGRTEEKQMEKWHFIIKVVCGFRIMLERALWSTWSHPHISSEQVTLPLAHP